MLPQYAATIHIIPRPRLPFWIILNPPKQWLEPLALDRQGLQDQMPRL